MDELYYGPDLGPVVVCPSSAGADPRMKEAFWYHQRGLVSQAAGLYRQILAWDPKQSEARHLLGLAEMSLGNLEAAARETVASLGHDPPAVCVMNAAMVLHAGRHHQKAVEMAQLACRLHPENVDFNTRLAAVQLHAGDLEAAAASVARSLDALPGDIHAMEVERQIRKRREELSQAAEMRPAKGVAARQSVDLATCDYTMTISARKKPGDVVTMLRELFGSVPLSKIDSIFGFNVPCRLYGGRMYMGQEVTDADLEWMYAHNIGYRIPLTNTMATEKDYELSRDFLARHHRPGNSVIIYKEWLAKAIRRDYPHYQIEASVIREVNDERKLMETLEFCDAVVPLPEAFNTNYRLLESFPADVKDRIRLFLNAGCAYHCPRRICYTAVSKMHLQMSGAQQECSQERFSFYFTQGMVDFPIQRFVDLGYRRFKLLRDRAGMTGY